jgi:hypothetical protein
VNALSGWVLKWLQVLDPVYVEPLFALEYAHSGKLLKKLVDMKITISITDAETGTDFFIINDTVLNGNIT